jgi:hypothetical protein
MGMILLERLFDLETKLVRQGSWGGPDLVACEPRSASIAMHVEVKTVPIPTQVLARKTTATIHIDKVRRKQSTVLLVVIYHEAGLDFFLRPTADFCARHGGESVRCAQKLTNSAATDESALLSVLQKML